MPQTLEEANEFYAQNRRSMRKPASYEEGISLVVPGGTTDHVCNSCGSIVS